MLLLFEKNHFYVESLGDYAQAPGMSRRSGSWPCVFARGSCIIIKQRACVKIRRVEIASKVDILT